MASPQSADSAGGTLQHLVELYRRHPQLSLSLSALSLLAGYFCYDRLKLRQFSAEDKSQGKEVQRRRSRLDSTASMRSSRSDLEKSPSFSKSPSYFEFASEDSAGASAAEWTSLGLEQPLVIAMVGLPARGKSYLVKMILRYLKWTGFECKVFNVGSFRRQVGLAAADSNFFDNSNADNQQIREKLAMAVQESMYTWLHESSSASSDGHTQAQAQSLKRRVAIFDATNTTRNRRYALAQRARKEDVFLLFVESICDDASVLARNYELKLQNDDYKNMDPDQARADFLQRVRAYEKVYETVDDDEDGGHISYIKLINVGQKVITRNCHGYLPSQVAFYLQNVHIQPRKIYLTINAENVEALLGDDLNVAGKESGVLTDAGQAYTELLVAYLQYERDHELVGAGKDVVVLTGTGRIHYESVSGLRAAEFQISHTPLLNELRGGDLHGLSKAEMKSAYPVEFDKRLNDKLNYRYPGVGGESYLDVIERVRPVIIELERQRKSVLIVCHLAVLRCIYAYFMGVPLAEIPFKSFERHKVLELSPGPLGCSCSIVEPRLPLLLDDEEM